MAPDPLRRGLVVITAAAAFSIGNGALAPDAHPTPDTPALQTVARQARIAPVKPPGEKELRGRLNALNTEAERLTERYNKARVELKKARAADAQAAGAAATLQRRAAPAREELARLAAADYMGGDPNRLLLSSGSADGLSASAYLARNRSAAVTQLQAQINRADQARKDAAAKTAQARRAAAGAAAAKKTAGAKVAQVKAQLDKLATTRVKDSTSGLSATVSSTGLPAKAARAALTKLGRPYSWGAAGPNSFDCSGLVVWAYGKVGKPGLPHYTGDLYATGAKVGKGELRSGDMVFFGGDLHHMGIYLSGGKYLHAPQTGDVVKISRLSERSDYAGAARIS